MKLCAVCPKSARPNSKFCSSACQARGRRQRLIKLGLCPGCRTPSPAPYIYCTRHRFKAQTYQADRRAAHLCFCGRGTHGTGALCMRHKAAQRATEKTRYYWYKENGICPDCKDSNALENHVLCRPCLDEHAARQRARYYRLKAQRAATTGTTNR